jgi:hypothetical protein
VKKKSPAKAKRGKHAKPRKTPHVAKPVSAATRAADEALREQLRHADMAKFDRVLAKAIRPAASR